MKDVINDKQDDKVEASGNSEKPRDVIILLHVYKTNFQVYYKLFIHVKVANFTYITTL